MRVIDASGSPVDRYLFSTLATTSMLLVNDYDPGQLCDQLLIAAEKEASVLAERDSLQKLFVRKLIVCISLPILNEY